MTRDDEEEEVPFRLEPVNVKKQLLPQHADIRPEERHFDSIDALREIEAERRKLEALESQFCGGNDENVNTNNIRPVKRAKKAPLKRVKCEELPKWSKLNEMLASLNMTRLEVSEDLGVSESSVILTLYTLLRDNTALRRKAELGDISDRLEKELEASLLTNAKLEQTIFVSLFYLKSLRGCNSSLKLRRIKRSRWIKGRRQGSSRSK